MNDAFDRYISTKTQLRGSTKSNYTYMYDRFVRDTFGMKKLAEIKYSDVLQYYLYLLEKMQLSLSTLDTIHGLLHPMFDMAVRDEIIRNNPSDSVMKEVKKNSDKNKGVRHALTIEQQRAFMEYMANHPVYCHWWPLFTVLLGTGCRIGEALGLRWDDLDFENNEIHVRRNLLYTEWEGSDKSTFHVTTPKTSKGIRIIPMMDEVREALLAEYRYQQATGFCRSVVDGVSGFVFRNKHGNPLHQGLINRAIKRVYESYNADEEKNACCEGRKPDLLPHFSCHIIRHTFCTRLCERETNVKVIQEIMGHADIQITLQIYAEVTDAVKHKTMEKIQGEENIF